MDRSRRGRRIPLHPAGLSPGRGAGRHGTEPSRTLRSRAARALRRATHRTIAAVSEALDSFAFNVAVARLYEFANAIAEAERGRRTGLGWARREAVEMLARLASPMMPHLAEEMYARLYPGRGVWWRSCPGRRPTRAAGGRHA